MEEVDLPLWVKAFGVLTAVPLIVLVTVWTWVAFVGGRLWPLDVYLDGGLLFGLFWLFVVDPLVLTVAYWISALVFVPVASIAVLARKRES